MTELSNFPTKLKPESPLKYGRDFTIEQLGMGSHNGLPQRNMFEKLKKTVKNGGKEPACINGYHCEPEGNPEIEPKMFVVKGFPERVSEYMKKRGFSYG